MSLASSPLDRADAPLFTDGLGERMVAADAATGELLQILRLRQELTAVPSFEFALRERTARLMNFRHAYYARVRRVDRQPAGGGLAVVSDHVEGTRLSDLLRGAQQRGLQLDTNAALCLIRQLVPAVALLHENARDASHGLIAPERLVVTPHARLVIVEHVLGSAIEQLQFGRERLWQEFRLALPSSAGATRFDHRADVNGIGITALSLVLGRPIAADEFPHAVPQLLMLAKERTPTGDERPLSNAFRNWLGRTLQLDVRRAFANATEALAALEETLAADPSYVAAPVSLETFLGQYTAALTQPAAAAPAPVQPPVTLQTPTLSIVPPPVAAAPGREPLVVVTSRTPETPRVSEPAEPVAVVANASVPTLAELIAVDDLRSAVAAAAPQRAAVPEAPLATVVPARPPAAVDEELAFLALDHSEPAARGAQSAPAVDVPDMGDVADDQDIVEVMRQGTAAVPPRGGSRVKLFAAAALLVALVGGGYAVSVWTTTANTPALGTLNVQSSPAGIEVFVDGVSRGTTPAKVSVAAGSHILELRGRGVPRVIPLQVAAGAQVSQYLEFADTPLTGMLVVHSQPAGANVTVDGIARGTAPLTLEGLSSGDHEVVLQNASGTSRHIVKVLAGTTASLVAPVVDAPGASDGPVSGWISVKAPFTIEIREEGQLLGTTESDKLMLASGRHTLEFVNQALSYRQSRVVQVVAGKVVPIVLDLPQGTVNLNAAPWAEVWMDGRKIGETPIGNLSVAIGPHEVVFRHPEFGEKKHAISVTTAAPVRLSVSMK
jgi:hypothetical protein